MVAEDKIMPQAQELERAIIGACLEFPITCKEVCQMISPEVFYNENNATIFKAIKAISDAGHTPDILSVTEKLTAQRKLDIVGGPFAIAEFGRNINTDASTEFHCRIVLEKYYRRKLIQISQQVQTQAYDDYYDVFDTMDAVTKEVRDLSSAVAPGQIVSNEDTLRELSKDIDEAKELGGIIGYSTGMKNLDHALLGLQGGRKYLIAARPGEGKSSLAKNIGLALAKEGIPGIFFSLEMTPKQLMLTCISEVLKIDNEKLQRGDISDFDKGRIQQLKDSLFIKHFLIDGTAGIDPVEMRSKIRSLVDSHKIKWFVVDYVGLQKLKGKEHRNKNREQIISDLTAENKNIAKEFNLICLELSQLSRESAKSGKRPQLFDLKDSGALEANADVVIFPYRPEYHGQKNVRGMDATGLAEIIIAKNRSGRPQIIAAKYIANQTQFIDDPDGVELEVVPEENPYAEEGGF